VAKLHRGKIQDRKGREVGKKALPQEKNADKKEGEWTHVVDGSRKALSRIWYEGLTRFGVKNFYIFKSKRT